jgi:hypothetical protein
VPNQPELERIMTWPKALKAFRFQQWGQPPCKYNLNFGVRILLVLRPQHTTLEELFLLNPRDPGWSDLGKNYGQVVQDGILSFFDFPELARLGVPREMLAMSQFATTRYILPFPEISLSVFEGLPPALEEFQMEVDPRFHWYEYFETSEPQRTTEFVGEMTTWLYDIAVNKKTRYPALTKVVL